MAFFTIFISPGLSRRDHRRAVLRGPRAVASNRGQSELVAAAGFVQVDEIDFTEQFLETARRWLRFALELEPALRASLGDDAFDEQIADRRDMVASSATRSGSSVVSDGLWIYGESIVRCSPRPVEPSLVSGGVCSSCGRRPCSVGTGRRSSGSGSTRGRVSPDGPRSTRRSAP